MSGHVHAELMAQYAKDAKVTDRPWELWEMDDSTGWVALAQMPRWNEYVKYRRKRIPREFWVNVYDDEEDSTVYLHTSPESAKDGLNGSTTGRTIHVREVINDED